MKNKVFYYCKIIFLMLLAFSISCNVKSKQIDSNLFSESFKGVWSSDDIKVIDQGTFFKLDFEEDVVTYDTGGPFEEELTVKVISDDEIELYFNSIIGSTSFMGAQGDKQSEECKTLVAKCRLVSDNEMFVETFEDKCGQIPENISITLKKLDEGEFCEMAAYKDDYLDDPFVEVVNSFDSKELFGLLGKREPEIITDLFLLLPDDMCFDLTVEDRKKMLNGEKIGEWNQMAIGKKDIENRYLSLSGAFEGMWEMYAQQDDEGIWQIAVNQQSCGPKCITEIGQSYIFEDRRMLSISYANLAGYQDYWPELFIDFDKLTTEQAENVKDVWDDNSGAVNILFRLPQDGKNITMYIDNLPYLEYDIPEEVFKEVKAEMWK